MNRLARFVTGICLLSIGFGAGFMYRNYQWIGALESIMTIPEQSSVERALIYSHKYYAGEVEAAHEWILKHALSDPEWNMNTGAHKNPLDQAIDFPSFQGLEHVRQSQLEKIRARQSELRERVGPNAL